MPRHPLSVRGRSERGADLVEFALVLPVFLLVFAGIVDAGFMLNNYNVVTNAAREGARVAVIPGWTADDVAARVNAYTAAAGLSTTPVVTVEPTDVTAGTSSLNAKTVIVSYPYTYLMLGPFLGGTVSGVTLTATATMRMEVAAGL